MPKYKIQYGLNGGFGGDNNDWETIETNSEQDALDIAYRNAIEEYESYEGMYGLRSVEQIMEEDELDEDEAEILYIDERESWLHYEVKEIE
jgi:hypothetical protein